LPQVDLPALASFRATVYDVGQGLAVLVQTAHHTLLFDAGPASGGGNPLPGALRAAGVSRLDSLVISNHDQGSVAGTLDVLAGFPVSTIRGLRPPLTAPDAPSYASIPVMPCHVGQSWQWDGVAFTLLAPDDAPQPGQSLTLRDCVLKIESPAGRFLIPANIEQAEQAHLVDRLGSQLQADVLLMPHHGSKGGWSPEFLQAVSPRWAIASAGYMNPYRHPRAEVVDAYREAGSTILETAQDGAVTVVAQERQVCLTAWRTTARHYWDSRTLPAPDACAASNQRSDQAGNVRPGMTAAASAR